MRKLGTKPQSHTVSKSSPGFWDSNHLCVRLVRAAWDWNHLCIRSDRMLVLLHIGIWMRNVPVSSGIWFPVGCAVGVGHWGGNPTSCLLVSISCSCSHACCWLPCFPAMTDSHPSGTVSPNKLFILLLVLVMVFQVFFFFLRTLL